MLISAVIPTRNRKERLLALLRCLEQSVYPLHEVIIIDSSDEQLAPAVFAPFSNLNIIYLPSESSVCIQRNKGIRAATGDWIFICDDDIEVPPDYIQKIAAHIDHHPETGAVSGIVVQQDKGKWQGNYPLTSAKELLWKYIFGLSIWGEINCADNLITSPIKKHYKQKGNHISKAGWPVLTDFNGDYVRIPVYGLGASVVKKEWLILSPYDEVLDKHGIGDNYGVAAGFPSAGIHLLNNAFAYHHHEPANRLQKPLQYYRRALALDYFIRTKESLSYIKKRWLLWSLFGNLLLFMLTRDKLMIRPAFKALRAVWSGRNSFYEAAKQGRKVTEPTL
ncbi:glycosyltransferase family 2 protein [Chitinophagaceae bacterium MMS25-I14]